MYKWRFIGDLSEDDAIIKAFPEDEPSLDEDNDDLGQTAADSDTSGQSESRVRNTSDVGLRQQQPSPKATRKSKRKITYNLRNQ